jgi:DNA mismatch repair protein MutS2
MKYAPIDLFEKLEFDKIIDLSIKECLGLPAVNKIKNIKPLYQYKAILHQLRLVETFKNTFLQNEIIPIQIYESVDEEIKLLGIKDFVLPVEGLQKINKLLLILKGLFQYFNIERQNLFEQLYALIQPIHFDPELSASIEKIIDEDGNVRPDASPALLKLRKQKLSKQRELDKKFNQIIAEYRGKGWLTDSIETFRNSRRVLSVPTEHKRKIKGIIHDESATGKTAYIEPDIVIAINNDIFDLEIEERKEIYKLLKELSNFLMPYADLILSYQDLVIEFDVLRSKARLALIMEGKRPKLVNQPQVEIKGGFHPILKLKNNSLGKKTIPFDLFLKDTNRILILSGPNAGGKSITMKSVGLLQIMLQSGFLIPVEESSIFGVFQSFFADIGDQQSIEDDLSTYSSRLQNMKVFLENCNENSLVLIDEFGSGTDPKIGGAIAEAILDGFKHTQVFGVITTHYSNLKMYAFKNKGLVNGAMTFNKETLTPSFNLRVGKPGSSYAFEIAIQSGLPSWIIDYAKNRTGEEVKAVDELLVDLQGEQQLLHGQIHELKEKEKHLSQLIHNYEQLHKELNVRRKRMKLDAKALELQNLDQKNRDYENLIRKIKEEKNLELAKKEAEKAKAAKREVIEEISSIRDDIFNTDTVEGLEKLRIGEYVKLKSSEIIGKVEAINGDRVILQIGDLRFTAEKKELKPAKTPLEFQTKKSIHTTIGPIEEQFDNKLDIRGMRLQEAIDLVEAFVDKALIKGTDSLYIVHGKGTGALRKAVRKKLKEYKNPMTLRHPEANQGGEGVTVVSLE